MIPCSHASNGSHELCLVAFAPILSKGRSNRTLSVRILQYMLNAMSAVSTIFSSTSTTSTISTSTISTFSTFFL
jgi:hypothetical protein